MLDENKLNLVPVLPKREARKGLLDAKTSFNIGVFDANQLLAVLRFNRVTEAVTTAVCSGSKVTKGA